MENFLNNYNKIYVVSVCKIQAGSPPIWGISLGNETIIYEALCGLSKQLSTEYV